MTSGFDWSKYETSEKTGFDWSKYEAKTPYWCSQDISFLGDKNEKAGGKDSTLLERAEGYFEKNNKFGEALALQRKSGGFAGAPALYPKEAKEVATEVATMAAIEAAYAPVIGKAMASQFAPKTLTALARLTQAGTTGAGVAAMNDARAPYSFSISTNSGISDAHGMHQVAQKFSTTGLPRRSFRATLWPLASLSVRSALGGSAQKPSAAARTTRTSGRTVLVLSLSAAGQPVTVAQQPDVVGEGRVAMRAQHFVGNAACAITVYRLADACLDHATAPRVHEARLSRNRESRAPKTEVVADQVHCRNAFHPLVEKSASIL